MFCSGRKISSNESEKRSSRALWPQDQPKGGLNWGEETKTQSDSPSKAKNGNTVLNNEDVTNRKNEKRKLLQDLKDMEAERKNIAKEMKKLDSERNRVLNKRKVYIRSKDDNNKLEEKIASQKKVWLNKQLRKKGVDGEAILQKVNKLVTKLVKIQEEATKELDKLNEVRAELREQSNNVKDARKKLAAGQEKLETDEVNLEKKLLEYNNRTNDAHTEEQRLKDLEVDIEVREVNLREESKQFDQLEPIINEKVQVISKHEAVVNAKVKDLKSEKDLVDNLKQNIYCSLEKRRATFNKKFSNLTSEYFQWVSAYNAILEGSAQEIQCIQTLKEKEIVIRDYRMVGRHKSEVDIEDELLTDVNQVPQSCEVKPGESEEIKNSELSERDENFTECGQTDLEADLILKSDVKLVNEEESEKLNVGDTPVLNAVAESQDVNVSDCLKEVNEDLSQEAEVSTGNDISSMSEQERKVENDISSMSEQERKVD